MVKKYNTNVVNFKILRFIIQIQDGGHKNNDNFIFFFRSDPIDWSIRR